MKRPARRLSVGALALAFLSIPALGASDENVGFDPGSWLQGADGMFEALRSLEQEPQEMVVYFYADWCGYCRQFEQKLLGTPAVKEYLSGVLAVLINPEKGEQEREIANYYGVHGYPGFFVRNTRTRTLSRVERMKLEGGAPRLRSPEEFIALCRNAARR